MKNYELKQLTSEDVFPMFQIISKIGIEEFSSCFNADEVKKAMEKVSASGDVSDIPRSVGLEIILKIANVLMKNLPSCKSEIYQFLAGVTGLSKKEISELPMNDFFNLVIDVIKKDEFKDFIGVVSRLFK